MKKVTLLSWVYLLAIVGFMAGCSKDSDDTPQIPTVPPTLTFTEGAQYTYTDKTIQGNTRFATRVHAHSSGASLSRYQASVSYNNGPSMVVLDTVLTGNQLQHTFWYNAAATAGTEKWTFTVTNQSNQTDSKSFTLTTTPVISVSFVAGPGLISANQTVEGGTPFKFSTIARSNLPGTPLTRYTVKVSYNGEPAYTVLDTTINTETLSRVLTREAQLIAGTERYIFTASSPGRTASSEILITTTAAQPINEISGGLGGQTNGNYGNFYSTANQGAVYYPAQAAANAASVDFVAFHNSANGFTLAAPNDPTALSIYSAMQNWSVRNATKFKSGLTEADFSIANTGAKLQQAYANASGPESSKANMLEQLDVVAFKTASGKYGMFRITQVFNSPGGVIGFNVKIQQ